MVGYLQLNNQPLTPFEHTVVYCDKERW